MVRNCVLLLLMTLLLAGCGAEETFETIADELVQPVMARPGHISVQLPGETALPVIENDSGRIYVCNDYEIVVQTLDGGDLDKTMQTVSGMEKENLTVMETFSDGVSRYEFVWASAGETGDQTGRGAILDDGNYHYCLSVLCNAENGEKTQINWDQVFSSFCLTSY